METISNKYCNLCSLSGSCATVCVEGRGADSGLMIVAEMPSWYDDKEDTVLGSPVAQLIEKIIVEVIGGNLDKVFKTHLVKCKTPESRKPTQHEIDTCKSYLLKEIDAVRPKAILALGDIVFSALMGDKVKPVKGKIHVTSFGKGENKFETRVVGTYTPYYVDKVQSKLEEFATHIMKAYNTAHGVSTAKGTQIVICDTFDKVKTAVEYCKQIGVCSFDFETPEIDEDKGTFLEGFHATSLSLSFQAGSAYVIPLEHFESPYSKAEVQEIMDYIGEHIFQNPAINKVGHNLSYDMHIARIYGCVVFKGRLDDTMLMHHLHDETKRHGLKDLVVEFFPECSGYEDEVKGFKWHEVPFGILAPYNGTDTDLTLRLKVLFESYLLEDERVYRIYRNLAMAVLRPLWNAERRGMLIDAEALSDAIKEAKVLIEKKEKQLVSHPVYKRYLKSKEIAANEMAQAELKEKISALEKKRMDKADSLESELEGATPKKQETLKKKITALRDGSDMTVTETNYRDKLRKIKSGEVSVYSGFNFGSWQQLEDLLYDSEFGFRFVNFTRGTGKDVLEDLKDDTGFLDTLLSLRSLEKINGTYLEGLWNRMDKYHRVHTQLLIHGTVSGRLSSRNPNLQNLPNIAKLKDEDVIRLVSMVKKVFKCPDGYTMVQFDFSQAELRIIASFAKEPTMLQAYADDKDLHALLGSKMKNVTMEEFYQLAKDIQKEARTRAKAGNFGFIYGMGWMGFMDYAKSNYKVYLSEGESRDFREMFFDTYPELLTYHEVQKEKARKFGWVRTLYGRRRRTPDIHAVDDLARSNDERVAINSPVQGTAGEFTIFAIALLDHRLHPSVELAITVHDSIVFYIPDHLLHKQMPIIRDTCQQLPNKQYFDVELKKVSMKVDAEITKLSWKDLEPYEYLS